VEYFTQIRMDKYLVSIDTADRYSTPREQCLGSRLEVTRACVLAWAVRKFHILHMVTTVKRTGRTRSSTSSEGTVVYRGIKIKLAPMSGKRSPTAEAIRDALNMKYSQSPGKASLG